jgi:hypothetical protein
VIGLACSPFAHHYSGNRCCFLFLWVLRCFTSPRYLHLPYVFRQGRWAITLHRVSPFGNPRIEVWLPTPRGLSQAPTSFIGSWCQGIHRAPLLTWQIHYGCDARVHYAVLKVRAVPAVPRPLRGATAGPDRGGPAAVPSGPNSVLGQRTTRSPRSVPPRRAY